MTKQIPLSQYGNNRGKFFATVDDEDYEILSQRTWHVSISHGKNVRAIGHITKNKKVLMHRVIMKDQLRPGLQVDHIDGNSLNNTRSNLRVCTCSQNMFNRDSPTTKKIAPYKGVFHANSPQGWMAQINFNKKQIHIGTYPTPEEAARAYDRKAIELHGEFARTNFPRSDYEAQA